MGKSRPTWGLLVVVAVLAAAAIVPATASAATATTGEATDVTSGSALLNGTASPTPSTPGSYYYFQYGTNPAAYSNQTPQTPLTASQPVSVPISGLSPGTVYHFQLVVGSPAESNTLGQDTTFMTLTAAVATTSQATSITSTSARLNGVANPGDSTSAWFFQYGPTTAYGRQTPAQSIGAGLTLISFRVTGLSPRTKYHFRLVVNQSSVMPNYGRDFVFTTATANGHAILTSRGLKVHHGFAAIPFSCNGVHGALCKGQIGLKARGKVGRHVATVSCGNGRLSTSATHRQTVHAKLGRCGGLFRNARHGRLHATLRAVFTTDQRPLQTGVTLIRP